VNTLNSSDGGLSSEAHRVCSVGWTGSIQTTATYLAHELGHLLGLSDIPALKD
jgi:hypothetical protein